MCDNNNTILYGRKIIRICCIATMLCMTFASCNSDEKTVFNDVTSETKVNNVQTSEIESETKEILPEFSISDEGVLTAYNGTESNVSIPDNVNSISADVFGASPVAGEIKTIKLGKSVENIDTQAFVSLTALESIEVPEENTYYRFIDGVLFKNDNTLFFCMPNIIKDDYDMFDVFFDIISDNIDGEGEALIVLKDIVAQINMEYVTSTDMGSVNRKYYLSCKAINTRNQTIEFDSPIYYKNNPNGERCNEINVFEVESGVVVSNVALDTGYGKTWILSQSGIGEVEIKAPYYTDREIGVEIEDGVWYDYNYSVILFYRGDDNTIKYTRFPHKYMVISDRYGSMSKYCTGMDEFAKEVGTVEIVNGQIVYNCEERLTVEEDLVGSYIKDSFDPDIYGYSTLEQYLSHNSEIYESAK